MRKKYKAHYRPEDKEYQYYEEHSRNVEMLAEKYCPIQRLKIAAWIIGKLHDAGKATEIWLEYFEKKLHEIEKRCGEKEDHSTIGGLIAGELVPPSLLREMLQLPIYMHHGIQDCISSGDGKVLADKRKQKFSEETVRTVKENILDEPQEKELVEKCKEAGRDVNSLVESIQKLSKSGDRPIYRYRYWYAKK